MATRYMVAQYAAVETLPDATQFDDGFVVVKAGVFYRVIDGAWVVVGLGPKGDDGDQGPTGPAGATGPAGPSGPQGLTGPASTAPGPAGPQGDPGPQGEPGATGATGEPGPTGQTGADGATGPIGATGPQGEQGVKGDTGSQGPQGLTGATGPQGETGAKGDTGAQGPQGLTGATGPQGLTGPQGTTGTTGAAGAAGATGATGAPGVDGRTVLYGTVAPTTVGANGDFYINTATNFLYGPKAGGAWPAGISLVGPTGATGNTGAQGTTGATGSTGAPGVDGRTVLSGNVAPANGIGANGDFYINTVTSTLYGPKAAGAWPNGVSLIGPTGQTGQTGQTGAPGTPTVIGAGANIVVTGTSSAPTVALASAVSTASVATTGTVTATGGLYDGANRAYSDSNPPETLRVTQTGSAPAAPPAGMGEYYMNNGRAYFKNATGQAYLIGGGSTTTVNVRDYGATGGGSVDDLAAINAAIAALPASGGVVFFPVGVYNVSATVTVAKGGVTLLGESKSGTAIQATFATGDIINLNEYYLTVRGLRIATTVVRTSGAAVNAPQPYSVVQDVLIYGTSTITHYNGVVWGSLSTLAVVDNVEVRFWTNYAVHSNGNGDKAIRGLVTDNPANNSAAAGIRVDLCASLQISNCNVIHAGVALDLFPAAGITIPSVYVMNSFFDNSVVGIRLGGTGTGTIYRSKFTQVWASSHTTAGIQISNPNVDGIEFVNMDLYGNAYGLQALTGVNWTLSHSRVAGNTTAGIDVTAQSNSVFRILDNIIGASGGWPVNAIGVRINAGTYSQYTVTGNDLTGSTTPLIDSGTATLGKRINANWPMPVPDTLTLASTVTVSASTADLYAFSFTIPANTALANTQIDFEIMGQATNGTTGSNLTCFVMLGATKYAVTTHALGTGAVASRPWLYRGSLNFKAIGASGSFIASAKYEGAIAIYTTAATATATNLAAYAASGAAATPTTINTTADIAVKIGLALSAATGTSAAVISGRVAQSSSR